MIEACCVTCPSVRNLFLPVDVFDMYSYSCFCTGIYYFPPQCDVQIKVMCAATDIRFPHLVIFTHLPL